MHLRTTSPLVSRVTQGKLLFLLFLRLLLTLSGGGDICSHTYVQLTAVLRHCRYSQTSGVDIATCDSLHARHIDKALSGRLQ